MEEGERGMELQYRMAEENDLDEIFDLFRQAIIVMDQNGIPQWDEIYPDKQVLSEDISHREMYVGTFGKEIAVVYVMNQEYDEQYRLGKWSYTGEDYRILHRFCVHPNYQNAGIGRKTIHYIETSLRRNGIESIRLDAFSRNPYALRLYQKAGYEIVGEAEFRKGRFYLMEKVEEVK